MDYNKLFKEAFSSVVPQGDDESFAKSVTERKISMSEKRKIRIRIKKPIIAICAAAAALSLGVTGAAAAGFINFNEIFGKTIRTQNAELGDKLIGNASDVKWTVSDDDYVVDLKGVTGTSERVMAVVEISRADGTPVRDYLKNTESLNETNLLGGITYLGFENSDVNSGKSIFSCVNESGNIEVDFEVWLGSYDTCGLTSVSGERFTIKGIGFYPAANFFSPELNEIAAHLAYGAEYEISLENKKKLEELAVLNLDWSLEFTYTSSETAKQSLSAVDLSQPIMFKDDIDRMVAVSTGDNCETKLEPYAKDVEFYANFDEITINSVGGKLSGQADLGEYGGLEYYSTHLNSAGWKFELIKNDGSKSNVMIFMSTGASSTNFETGVMEFDFELEFHQGGGQTAIDLSEISGISINGVTYQLS